MEVCLTKTLKSSVISRGVEGPSTHMHLVENEKVSTDGLVRYFASTVRRQVLGRYRGMSGVLGPVDGVTLGL